MKKVLFTANVVKLHINVFHLPYLEWFKQNGYETHVAAKNDYVQEECTIPNCDKFYDIDFKNFPFKIKNLIAYRKLKRIIETNDYDIIHCHTPVASILTRLAARNARKKGTKVIYTAHGFHFYKGAPLANWILYYPAERICARFTDVIITINSEDYNRAKGFSAKKVEYVSGVGIDTNKIQGVSMDTEKQRQEIGIPARALVLISVGRLAKGKNYKTIIKALAKIKNPDIIYLICGQGDLEKSLKDFAWKMGVDTQIKFLNFRKDIFNLYHASDIFVFPSMREGLPVSLMEAMAAGLPVICSNIRGNADIIVEGENGYMVKSKDDTCFAKLIQHLAKDKPLRERMGENNIAAVKKYDIKKVLAEVTEIYNKMY